MSGIAGMYNLDGRPLDPALLQRMTDAIVHRGPDGINHWIDGPVGLGHCMLHTTPESLHELQPLTDETGSLCLTLDGRVDNREELKDALIGKGARLRTDTDAELILHAYGYWGEECPKRIIGDFAFAIWDRKDQQLFCVRDPIGIKPLYYYHDSNRFIFGSELRQLFEDITIPRQPNEGMIGEYLAVAITDNEETLYKSILRLPLGHCLIIRPGRIRKVKYWDIDPSREIRHRTDGEYTEQFLDIFRESVRCRLRSHKPVGAYLSGGLDSSSVVGIAHALCFDHRVAAKKLETFSMLFPGVSDCDESEYIEKVLEMWSLTSNSVWPEPAAAGWYAQQASRYYDFPDYPNGTMMEPLLALARGKGLRVILSGFGGDELLTGSSGYCADLLRERQILRWLQQIRFESRRRGGGISQTLAVVRRSMTPLIPQATRQAVRSVLNRNHQTPLGLNAQFAHRIQLTERLRRATNWPRFPKLVQTSMYRMLAGGSILHAREIQDRFTSRLGIEERHPFSDQRLTEFAFAIPEEQRCRNEQTKFVLREAMRGFLPEPIRQRLTKADFSHVFPVALKAQGAERTFESLNVASFGWVAGHQVREMYQQMRRLYQQRNAGYINLNWPLWMIFGIELWVRAVFDVKDIDTTNRRKIAAA